MPTVFADILTFVRVRSRQVPSAYFAAWVFFKSFHWVGRRSLKGECSSASSEDIIVIATHGNL